MTAIFCPLKDITPRLNITPHPWYKKHETNSAPSPLITQGEETNVNQILAAVVKAVLVTLVSTLAAIGIEKIRRYNEERNEEGYYQPGYDEYDRY